MKEKLKRPSNLDIYLVLIILLSAAYFTYWIAFGNYMYSTFQDNFYDIGGWAYIMYMHVHGFQFANVLQSFVFFGHISPFLLLIVPIFALYKQPIMLFIIQDVFLALTVVLAYLVAKDVLSNKKIAFVLALAFLINPGIRGLVYYDFHPEAFIPFFYILAFYFYYKGKSAYFVLSYVLLLSIIETAYLAAGPMLIMLLVYELMYNSKSIGLERERYKKRLKIIAIGILITACAALFYHVATLYIIKSYSTTSDYAVPPITRIVNFIKIQSVIFTHPEAFSYSAISIDVYGGFGLLSIVLGFGVSSLLNPIGSLIAYSPWIVEVFGLHNLIFASFASQYYGYIVGASFVSALLGLLVLFRYKKKISEMLRTDVRTLEAFVFLSMFVLALVTTVVVLPFGIKLSLLKLQSIPNVSISQIDTGLATIPENASVMTTPYIMPHLYYVRNLELTPVYNNSGLYASNLTVYWFVPDYIVVDRNLEDYNYVSNVPFDVYTYMGDNYTQYYNDSGLYIYKRKSS